jgi:hypothetical protein
MILHVFGAVALFVAVLFSTLILIDWWRDW